MSDAITLPEKLIEAKFIDALRAAVPSATIEGGWTCAAPGGLKNLEPLSADVVLAVSVGVRRYDTAQIPTCDIPVSVAVAVREDTDPTGETFAATVAAVASMMQSWQDSISAAQDALNAPPFMLAGFRMDGGGAPTRDGEAWSVNISATVRGVITQISTGNANNP